LPLDKNGPLRGFGARREPHLAHDEVERAATLAGLVVAPDTFLDVYR
jgi:hypothetical protein